MVKEKLKRRYATGEIVKSIINIDDDITFYNRYIPFSDMKDELFNFSRCPGIIRNGVWLVASPYFMDFVLKNEVYKWCIKNGFCYKKIQLVTKDNLLENRTTGLLFTRESDAVAFKLRWI